MVLLIERFVNVRQIQLRIVVEGIKKINIATLKRKLMVHVTSAVKEVKDDDLVYVPCPSLHIAVVDSAGNEKVQRLQETPARNRSHWVSEKIVALYVLLTHHASKGLLAKFVGMVPEPHDELLQELSRVRVGLSVDNTNVEALGTKISGQEKLSLVPMRQDLGQRALKSTTSKSRDKTSKPKLTIAAIM